MRPCPECGQPVENDVRLCPHCGTALPLFDAPPPPPSEPPPAVWPPPPTGYGPPVPEGPGPLVTKSVRGDVAVGFVAASVLCLGLPLLSVPLASHWDGYWLLWFGLCGPTVLALAYKSKLPSFARGAKYCAWTQGALILGALALCFSSLAGVGR